MSKAMIRYYSNPSARKKTSASGKKYYSIHPMSKKRSNALHEALRKYYSNPANRKKMSLLKKKQYREHPELADKIDRETTEWWHSHPNARKEDSIKVRRFFIEHPEKFKKFLKYGKDINIPHLRTKQGFVVRSHGEQTIANFLYDNKIPSQYESKTLIFEKEGQICIPDFYLPKYKIYIEFYGGFPAAWKKKVMKNKLYKKHKIPCIFITPGELRDLKGNLMGELGRGK